MNTTNRINLLFFFFTRKSYIYVYSIGRNNVTFFNLFNERDHVNKDQYVTLVSIKLKLYKLKSKNSADAEFFFICCPTRART